MPGHKLVDVRLRPTVDEARQQFGEVGLRVDAVDLAGLDQRGEIGPILPAFVTAGEQAILPGESNGSHAPLDTVGVELDASVVQEPLEPVPVAQRITDGSGGRTSAR